MPILNVLFGPFTYNRNGTIFSLGNFLLYWVLQAPRYNPAISHPLVRTDLGGQRRAFLAVGAEQRAYLAGVGSLEF